MNNRSLITPQYVLVPPTTSTPEDLFILQGVAHRDPDIRAAISTLYEIGYSVEEFRDPSPGAAPSAVLSLTLDDTMPRSAAQCRARAEAACAYINAQYPTSSSNGDLHSLFQEPLRG